MSVTYVTYKFGESMMKISFVIPIDSHPQRFADFFEWLSEKMEALNREDIGDFEIIERKIIAICKQPPPHLLISQKATHGESSFPLLSCVTPATPPPQLGPDSNPKSQTQPDTQLAASNNQNRIRNRTKTKAKNTTNSCDTQPPVLCQQNRIDNNSVSQPSIPHVYSRQNSANASTTAPSEAYGHQNIANTSAIVQPHATQFYNHQNMTNGTLVAAQPQVSHVYTNQTRTDTNSIAQPQASHVSTVAQPTVYTSPSFTNASCTLSSTLSAARPVYSQPEVGHNGMDRVEAAAALLMLKQPLSQASVSGQEVSQQSVYQMQSGTERTSSKPSLQQRRREPRSQSREETLQQRIELVEKYVLPRLQPHVPDVTPGAYEPLATPIYNSSQSRLRLHHAMCATETVPPVLRPILHEMTQDRVISRCPNCSAPLLDEKLAKQKRL